MALDATTVITVTIAIVQKAILKKIEILMGETFEHPKPVNTLTHDMNPLGRIIAYDFSNLTECEKNMESNYGCDISETDGCDSCDFCDHGW